jgi:phosphomannomutase
VENGGVAVRTRVGHSFIKATMAETNAIFGGEHSGHFYFRDFWRADSGMLAALHAIAALGEAPAGTTFSSLLTPYLRYTPSGEINTEVQDQQSAVDRIRAAYESQVGVSVDDLDGMTIDGGDWWFNVRSSNTEPLLRLNVEAADASTMEQIRDDVLAMMRAGA